jgi:nucleotide-binding universal stress UspA family protein
MSFATLMVHLDLYDVSEQRVRLACDLADRFNSVLIGVSAGAPMPPPADSGFAGGQLVADQTRDMTARLEQNERDFRAVAGNARAQVEWRSELSFPIEVVTREARAADLVVIGRDPALGGYYQSLDSAAAILQMGRPVLAVPPRLDSLSAENIIIGWKDTREARCAVKSSLPFLQAANHVTVAEVCEEDMEIAARRRVDDVASYLSRHRVKAVGHVIPPIWDSAAAQLMRLAEIEKADLIVAGGYGHSRLGEWIFGGVTWELLTSCRVCCLLAH